MTKRIRPHVLEAEFNPDVKMRARSHFEKIAHEQIMDEGYVPVLDRDTVWYTSWDDEKDTYGCKLVVFCVYAGTRKAREEFAGWNEAEGKWVKFDGQFQ